MTSNTRPITPSPTGIEIGPPVSVTATAALEALGAGHGDGAHPVVAEVLLHFERQLDRLALDGVVDRQRVEDRRQRVGKLDVDDRTHDLNDFADIHKFLFRQAVTPPGRRQSPAIPS